MCLERTSGNDILLTSHSYVVKDSPGNSAAGRPTQSAGSLPMRPAVTGSKAAQRPGAAPSAAE